MSDFDEMRAKVMAAVRGNVDLVDLVAMMPLPAEARDAVWQTLAVAYSAGMLAGADAVIEKMK